MHSTALLTWDETRQLDTPTRLDICPKLA